ncbi:MAG: polysaccharide deacetylase family protein [Acetivibrionales bacterium]
MIYMYAEDRHFCRQIEYVLDTVFHILGIEYKLITNIKSVKGTERDILILYGGNIGCIDNVQAAGVIFIKQSSMLFGPAYLTETSLPRYAQKCNYSYRKYGIKDFISLYGDNREPYIREQGTDKRIICTNMDIISDIFFMLTRYEEVVRSKNVNKDEYGRFPARESVASRYGFLHRPVVNEAIELLWAWIDSFGTGCERMNPWGRKDFVACLSHDVDWISTYDNKSAARVLMTTASLLLRRRKPEEAWKYLTGYVRNLIDYKRDPYWTFDYMTKLEKEYGCSSSFYFMSGGTTCFDGRYRIEGRKARKLVEALEERGFEVGYHGSFDSCKSFPHIWSEKLKLDGIINTGTYGCRQHYLRFEAPLTWRIQEKCGLLYDTTVGYAEREGFRAGICVPYKPYDIFNNRTMDIWEIPLIAMDDTYHSYLALDSGEVLERLEFYMDIVRKYKGVFTLLVHNTSFHNHRLLDWNTNYCRILEKINEKNGIGLSGRDVIMTWKVK